MRNLRCCCCGCRRRGPAALRTDLKREIEAVLAAIVVEAEEDRPEQLGLPIAIFRGGRRKIRLQKIERMIGIG